ncbi:MAG: peptidase and chymotrypsin/Hap [Marmoricola sp.]|nr:peptidase and chymotrypsin/Hap [Marmoricola sp.]
MDEQNRYPNESDDSAGASGDSDHTSPIPAYQGDSATSSLPPVVGPFYGTQTLSAPAPAQSRRSLTAGVLVAALVLGGAAGVGGAAAFQALNDDGTITGTSTTPGDFQATKTALVQEGTVEKVANAVLPSVVKVNVTGQSGSGSGSGIVLSKDGKVLTNNHVVAGLGDNGSMSVSFNDGTTKKAKVVGTDPLTDVAVIQVEGVSDLVPAALGQSGGLKVGQAVVAVGSPYGLNATVTSGIVSALNRPVSVSAEQGQAPQNPFGSPQDQPQAQGQDLSTTYPAIQTDAAINPGNSGGPLVDLSGRVVGINSSIRTASSNGLSGDTGGSIGLGFAIPIDEVLPIVNQINDGDKPTHARLGVSVSDVSGDSLNQGAQLQTIENGGAAAKAGLKKGDVITKVGDQVVDGSESLVATIRGHRPGEQVQITYLRGGKSSTTTADLGSDANTTAS